MGANLEERRVQMLEGLRRKPLLGLSLHGEVFHGGLAITFVRVHTRRGRAHMPEEGASCGEGAHLGEEGSSIACGIASFLLERLTLESRGSILE